MLHNIGIENLPGCEKYNFYRLSSTRELARRHSATTIRDAVFYGGLLYDITPDEMKQESVAYHVSSGNRSLTQVLAEGFNGRGAVRGLPYLEGTLTEVNAIADMTKTKKIETKLFTGSKGNEESFKMLDGSNIQLLHIATHGFYLADNTVNESDEADDLRPQRNVEDQTMTRSGLLMAGAENALNNDLPDNVEDGLLTAQEIAQLDLNKLDMVVLSACETALGDITKGEGVFGLQRGFKKAGAQSLLMSLWEVDDKATSMLMTAFYQNWLNGKSKHEALELAKQTVRSHTEWGWDKPMYWAAFILLDAIE